ncbi:MAG: nucleotidyltransferase domain-containing protein [Bacteroidales bacterium]|nr:nucleotidyltransferase domain-containing protein [Bacteroidales bacterium]
MYDKVDMNEEIPYLKDIVSIICSLVSPDCIILFGSYARGNNNKNIDIDLLVIKDELKKERKVMNTLYMAFFEKGIRKAVDLLAIDKNKYDQLNNECGLIYKTIKQEGKIIYGTI